MNWEYYNPKFEYEEIFEDLSWPWAGHKYFAYDLISNIKPKIIVELGTHYGTSLWSFSQAVKDQKLNTEINAIDTWKGDKHAGFYGEEIYETVKDIKNKFYSGVKINLIRKTFDEALSDFNDDSIDILHIDGLHTYEAVKHDFENWLPKVKNNGIIIFHDTVVSREDFGVYKLWKELKKTYQSIEFFHSYGLGVLFKDENNSIFGLKEELELHYAYLLEDIENGKIVKLFNDLNEKNKIIEKKNQEIESKESIIQKKDLEINSKIFEIEFMKSSRFWKIKTFYEKFKNPILKAIKLIKKAIVILKKDGLIIFTKKVINFILNYKTNRNIFLMPCLNVNNISNEIFNKQQNEFSKEEIKLQIKNFSKKPLISIIVPVYNTPPIWLRKAIDSLCNQYYENWEICAVDDFSTNDKTRLILKEYGKLDPRVKFIFLGENGGISNASNIALEMAKGEYVALLDHDDELTKDALFWVVKEINDNPTADFLYSDECKIDDTEERKLFDFFFKPDWSPEFLFNFMYTGHFTIYKKKLVNEVGNFRSEYDFSQDYDLALRCSEKAKNIVHIERVLYLWRAVDGSAANGGKDYARKTNIAALQDFAHRKGLLARATILPNANYLNIINNINKKISIIIPSDSIDNIIRSIENIIKKTNYPLFEVIVVCNSNIKNNLEQKYKQKNIIFKPYDKQFNFSDKCNQGAQKALGDILVFYNDDVVPINDDWLVKLIEYIDINGIGGISPKLLYEDGTVQYAGMTTNSLPFCGTFLHQKNESETMVNLLRNVSILSGACLAIKKSIFFEVGGFDSINTPAGHSDLDLSFKIRDAGYRCVYTPYSVLSHIGNHSWHIKKDKADIYVLSRWGKYISNDPYYTKSMRATYEGYLPEQFGIFSKQSEFFKKKFNVLIVIHELTITGAPIIAFDIAKAVLELGGYPVMYSYSDGPLRFELEKLNIPVIVNNIAKQDEFSFINFAKNFDVIIANTVVTYPAVHMIQDIVPTIWYIHEAQNIESFFIPYFDNNKIKLEDTLKNTRATICVPSEYSLNVVKKYNKNVQLFRYGFNDLYDKEIDIKKDIQFSIIGTIEDRKAQDIFVEAILLMPEKYQKKAKFNIIGNDKTCLSFSQKLKEKTKKIPSVVWHGLILDQNKKKNLFIKTSILVVISRDDCAPLVVTEGAVLMKPSIISTNVGTCFPFDNGKTGFIVETGNIKQLAETMMNIIDNPSILNSMGEEARKRYLETSTIDLFRNKILSLIKEKTNLKI